MLIFARAKLLDMTFLTVRRWEPITRNSVQFREPENLTWGLRIEPDFILQETNNETDFPEHNNRHTVYF
jgi:hypothetical protein